VYDAACGYGLVLRALDAGRPLDRLSPAEQKQRADYANRAFDLLRRAVRLGYTDLARVRRDRDLEALLSDPRFATLSGEVGKPVDESPSRDPKALRYRFKPGETLRYTAEMKMTQVMASNGRTATGEVQMTAEALMQVKSVAADGSARVAVKTERLRMTLQVGNRKIVFDSRGEKPGEDNPDGLFLNVMHRAAAIECEATVDVRGRVRDVKFPASLKDLRATVPANLAYMVSDEDLRRQFGLDALAVLPDAPPVPGTTWASPPRRQTSPTGTFTTRTKCTYVGPEMRDGRQLEKLALTGRMDFAPGAQVQGLMTLKSRSLKGESFFDRAAGRWVETTTRAEMEMEFNTGREKVVMRMTATGSGRLAK
jgi:hypothetical protein